MKNKKKKVQIVGFLFLLSIQSCAVIYAPSMENTPMLQEKHEVSATVGLSDFQAAYAVTNHFGVMLNGHYKNGSSFSISEDNGFEDYTTSKESSRKHIEGGVGLFNKLGEKTLVEIYGGFGGGNTTLKKYERYSTDTVSSLRNRFNADYTRFFLQPAIGITTDYLDFIFSMRILIQKYQNVRTFGYSTPEELYSDKLYQIDQPSFLFFEPALTMRFGYKYVKLEAQVILSNQLNADQLDNMPLVFKVGIHLDLAKRWDTKKSSAPSIPHSEE